jgi:peroxiredoxin
MTIAIGDRLPEANFGFRTVDGIGTVSARDYFANRRIVLFGVPGAFTPVCHGNHLPSFLAAADEIRAKGVDAIAVTAVNDIFVLDAWIAASGARGKIDALADGSGVFHRATGLDLDLGERGLGLRAKRYAMIVEDGVVQTLDIEEDPGAMTVSGADTVLAKL